MEDDPFSLGDMPDFFGDVDSKFDDIFNSFRGDLDQSLRDLNERWQKDLDSSVFNRPFEPSTRARPQSDADKIENVKNSVCVITGFKNVNGQQAVSSSHGIFLTPFHVLTAWHCVHGLSDVRFEDINGKITGNIKGWNKKSEQLDLAIAELDDPIGPGYSPLLTKGDYKLGKGWLVTRFNGFPQKHSVAYDMSETIGRNDKKMAFNTDVWVGQGYSGSPIVNEEGRIISVVSSIQVSEQELAEIEKKKGSPVGPGEKSKFFCPHPAAFADWIQGAFIDPEV